MIAYVMRELRRQKVVNERKLRRNPSAEDTPPTLTVRELAELFPTLSDGVIRSRLKDRCSCVSYKVLTQHSQSCKAHSVFTCPNSGLCSHHEYSSL